MSDGAPRTLVVSTIALRSLRNVEAIDLDLHPRLNLLVGANGQGKTTILEGLYLLGATKSFRGGRPNELLRHGESRGEARGRIRRGEEVESELVVSLERGVTRSVEVDGKRADFSSHFRLFPMIVFHPGDLELIYGGPSVRRRFLDRMLFQAEPGYSTWHRDYRRALQSRNELLRSGAEPDQIRAFDEVLASRGARIGRARSRMIGSLAEVTKRVLADLAAPAFDLVLESCGEPDEEELLSALRDALGRDRARGRTSIGPHADDLWVGRAEGRAREVASRGEARVLAVALKLAQREVVGAEAEAVPLLLLDDVAAELDRERMAKVVSIASGQVGQVVVTATGAAEGEFGPGWRRVEVRNGSVLSITDS